MRLLETLLPVVFAHLVLATSGGVWKGPSHKCPDVLKTLKKAVSDDSTLLVPGSTEYEKEMTRAYNFAASEVRPKVIARPTSSKQAAKIVKALVDNDCGFAIMSGGHSPITQANHSPNVIISTSGLRVLKYQSKNVLSVSPGYRWIDVYKKSEERGQTLAGGRHADVGIAGFLLGGGISHLSFEHGWGCDTIVNIELILPSGELITANALSHPKLFWAIKGGMNNFGLVTRFDLRTFNQPPTIFGGQLIYDTPEVPQALAAYNHWQTVDQPNNIQQSVILYSATGRLLNTDKIQSIVVLYDGNSWTSSSGVSPKSMKPFVSIPSLVNTVGPTTHLNFTVDTAAGEVHTYRQIFYSGTYRADAYLDQYAHDLIFPELLPILKGTGTLIVAVQPISESFLKKHHGKRAINLDPKGAPYTVLLISVEYEDPALDDILQKKSNELIEKVRKEAFRIGKGTDFFYVNDIGEGQQEKVFKGYGEDVVRRLREVRKEYDGEKWSRLVTGGYRF